MTGAPHGWRILHGLPEGLRGEGARLYWQAFGPKLGRVMGPDDRALPFLARAIRTDHAVVALSADGRLLGLAGFRSPQGAFADTTLRDLIRGYGIFGGMWRAAALRLLAREIDNERFLFDGICVDRAARGQGVGTALIEAAADLAAGRGYGQLRLDVIDTNLRARALYERLGFRAAGVQRLGPLRHLFGFDTAITMVRAV
ncbi:MAG: GNAT family N-acetyltransferase [Paracoccaceae bacterium]|nr:MAG: GNAT family N-acetyltransferase [Paracoccaceae bacterium]